MQAQLVLKIAQCVRFAERGHTVQFLDVLCVNFAQVELIRQQVHRYALHAGQAPSQSCMEHRPHLFA